MTESEYLTSTDSQAMLAFLTASVRGVTYDNPTIAAGVPLITPRKLRLFACACCRQAWDGVPCGPPCNGRGGWEDADEGQLVTHRDCYGTGRVGGLTDPRSRRAVETAERYADGEATHDELTEAYYDGARPNENVSLAVRWCSTGHTGYTAYEKARNTAQELRGAGQSPVVQAALLRCIVGNPWRPVTWRCPCGQEVVCVGDWRKTWRCNHCGEPGPWHAILRWDGGPVPQMARAIYDDRDWALLPQLADAMEEAGCPAEEACPRCEGRGDGLENGTMESSCQDCHGTGRVPHPLLAHLRGRDAGPCPSCAGSGEDQRESCFGDCPACHGTGRVPAVHARGCHVLDLLLGLS